MVMSVRLLTLFLHPNSIKVATPQGSTIVVSDFFARYGKTGKRAYG